jgi:CRP-like cAMP-binding protein
MISESVLRKYKAELVRVRKSEPLFHAGDAATNFYIVRSGRIKMANYSRDGREFIQGYFSSGQSFGEPPFFNNIPYPSSGVAMVDSEVWRCPHTAFMKLLRDNFDIHLKVTQVLSGRLVYKAIMLSEIAGEEADHRLSTLIEYFRRDEGVPDTERYRVPYTRQQLADMTGLRVETVIRCIKGMEQRGLLRLTEGGKILWGRSETGLERSKRR